MIKPPIATKIPHHTTVHGLERVDDYHWLRDDSRTRTEVLEYLKAENAYTEAMMAHTEALQAKLYEEMVSRINETDLSVPVQKGGFYYYSRTEAGKNYGIYCRKRGSLDAEEEVLLDANVLAEGKEYFSLGAFEVSPDHQLLAYSVDTDGSEYYDLYVKDLRTGELLPDTVAKTAGGLEWANDNATFFYVMSDEAHRPYQLRRHQLGHSTAADVVVLEEKDDRFFLGVSKTRDDQYLKVDLGSKVTSEVHLLAADRPLDEFQCFQPRVQGMEYDVSHRDGVFYIVTNEGGAVNFKLMTANAGATTLDNWVERIGHQDEVYLQGVSLFREFMVIHSRKGGLRMLTVHAFATGETHDIEFPESVYTCWGSSNPTFDTTIFRLNYTSLITPQTVYDYDMATRQLTVLKVYEVQGDGFDRDNYVTERIYATAEDGTQVPVSIAYRKGLTLDGTHPCYLYGYGSYGINLDPRFSTVRLSLLDRGFVFAMAHIRGGSEMGRLWYETGKFLQKKNTFTDFISVAETLIEKGYTQSDRLAISGGSAGGLLMGAVTNMRPDLFRVVVADVPFVDVMNTMLDESIPLTVTEYEEWGNPNDRIYFEYMLSYSPYDNVGRKAYPHMLITGGLNDPRVQYWEPAKWAAKLRDYKVGDGTLLLKTNMGAGHGGASGRYERIKEMAFEYAFVLDKMPMAFTDK